MVQVYPTCGMVNPETLPMTGTSSMKPERLRKVSGIVADFLPFVGTGKAISELIFGYDHISGENVHRVVAGFAVAGSLIPIPGAGKVGKFVGIAVKELGPKIKTIWSPAKHMGPLENAMRHFQKHGSEFQEFKMLNNT